MRWLRTFIVRNLKSESTPGLSVAPQKVGETKDFEHVGGLDASRLRTKIPRQMLSPETLKMTKLKKVTIRVRGLNGSVAFEEKNGMLKTPALIDYKKNSLWYQLHHYKQTEKWDCGITCVSMILAYVVYYPV